MRKKMTKKVFRSILSIVLATSLIFPLAFSSAAASQMEDASRLLSILSKNMHPNITQGHYRIMHKDSGRYIDAEYDSAGAVPKIRSKKIGNQFQIFFLKNMGNGLWQIRVHGSNNKIIEVRDSSSADGAEVASWWDNGQTCGLWKIGYNLNGTVTFINAKSGKCLNVYNNNKSDGTKLQQWYKDNSGAEQFIATKMNHTTDVYAATWKRDFLNDGIAFNTRKNANKAMQRQYASPWSVWRGDYFYIPKAGQIQLATYTWYSSEQAHNLFKNENKPETWKSKLWGAVITETASNVVSYVATDLLETSGLPFGYALAIVEPLASIPFEREKKELWNSFQYGKGIIQKTEYWFLYDPSIFFFPVTTYQSWNGSVLTVPSEVSKCKGTWEYMFK